MDLSQVFGFIGAFLLTITLMPQLYLTLKTKEVKNLSLGFLFLQELTCIFFLIYGLLLGEIPLIAANSITVTQSLILIILKLKYK